MDWKSRITKKGKETHTLTFSIYRFLIIKDIGENEYHITKYEEDWGGLGKYIGWRISLEDAKKLVESKYHIL